jgi:hypothetical protein
MTTEQLPKLIKATPFTPFTIRTADGREIKVLHPEAIAYPGGRIAVVVSPDESVDIIDLLLVPTLQILGPGQVEAG